MNTPEEIDIAHTVVELIWGIERRYGTEKVATTPDIINALALLGFDTREVRHAIELAIECGAIKYDMRLHLRHGRGIGALP